MILIYYKYENTNIFIYILILPNYSFADVINVDNLKIIKLIDKGTPIIDIRRG